MSVKESPIIYTITDEKTESCLRECENKYGSSTIQYGKNYNETYMKPNYCLGLIKCYNKCVKELSNSKSDNGE